MSLEIRKLKEEAAHIIEEARWKLNEADSATEARAAEIHAEVDKMFADADKLEARATQREELEKREAAINAADPRRTAETRGLTGETADAETRAAQAFDAYIRGQDLTREQRSALRVETRAGQSVADAARGGYLVPSALADAIVIAASAGRPMLDAGFVNYITTSNGSGLSVPVLNNPNQKGRRIAEGAAAARGELVFDKKDLNPFKYTSDFIPVTSELMADSAYDVAGLIASQTGELVGRIVNEDLTKGTGVAMPFGVVSSAGVGLTGATAAKIDADDLIDLQYSVGVQYHQGAKFMLNQNTLAKIRKLKNAEGDYIWIQGFGATPNTVLGHEYAINSEMADIATNSLSVAFGDFKKGYTVRQIGNPSLKRADELGLGNDEILFILYARYAGNVMDPNAIKVLKTK